mmetsp:Transcript_11447/g.44494  ORF Transcript_11447/g.44494 Transcript_11447/m.44494 type:complete len:262 (+) Transcript_11447:3971-4756(+)
MRQSPTQLCVSEYGDPLHVNVSGSPSAQNRVVPFVRRSAGSDVTTYSSESPSESRASSRNASEMAPLVVVRTSFTKTLGRALTSISATPPLAHVPSSTTHATYRSIAAGEPGHALPPAAPPLGVGVTMTRPPGSVTSTAAPSCPSSKERNRDPREPSEASYWYTSALSGCGAVNTSRLIVNAPGTSTPTGVDVTVTGSVTRTSPSPDATELGHDAGRGGVVGSSGHTYRVEGGTCRQSASLLRGCDPVSALTGARTAFTVS